MQGKEIHPLRKARQHLDRPLTQKQLAELTGISESTIQRAERGEPIGIDTIQRLCDFFKKSAQELGLTRDSDEGNTVTNETTDPYFSLVTQGIIPKQSIAVPTSAVSQEGENMDEKRRILLERILKTAGSALACDMWLNHDEPDQLIRFLTKVPALDVATLRGLKNTTQSYWQLRLRGAVAAPELVDAALAHFQLTKRLFQASHTPGSRTFLCSIFSEIALFIGLVLSNDLNMVDNGLSYYKLSLAAAQQANDDILYATGLARMGSYTAILGKPKEALVFLLEAQRLITSRNAFTLRSWLAAEEAEVQAVLAAQQDSERFSAHLAALEKAETSAACISPHETTFGIYFDKGRIPAYKGSCNIRLYRPEAALVDLEHALKLYVPRYPLLGAVILDLAEASLQANSPEQVCHYIEQALDIIVPTQARRPLHRIHTLRQQLEPWQTAQEVKDLDERLRALSQLG